MNTPTQPMTDTHKVANRFYELCTAGEYDRAMKELYADDARHVEAMEMPGSPYKRITEGKPALVKMSEHWRKTTTVHGGTVSKPLVNGDQFVCEMSLDCTSSEGPMAGQRMKMSETCLYTVKNGKISEAKFFYACG
ncbi:MAG TPA: nuclear transport factor 2 family protein [Phycisphaerales bacterium]|nr:nuclear transport factor 2 family protein [Phycisphaerales bacterium]